MRFISCLVLVGCATTAPSDPYDVDLASGAADGAGVAVHDVSAGDHLALSVDAGEMVALRLSGDAAVVVRRTSGDLDPYIIVKDATKRTLAQSVDQMIAPSLDPRDAIVIASNAFVLVSGEDLETGGAFAVDLVELPAPRSMPLEGTNARVAGGELRELEPARVAAFANGYLIENADGTIELYRPTIPLGERGGIARLVADLTETRTALAEGLAPDAPADALANLAAIWSAR